jgi:hypothetical protein
MVGGVIVCDMSFQEGQSGGLVKYVDLQGKSGGHSTNDSFSVFLRDPGGKKVLIKLVITTHGR